MDSATSRDLDDALRFEPLDDGGWHVNIYVAAPGLELAAHHDSFTQALQRRTTRYLPNARTIPMLGDSIERGYSLLPGEARAALHISCVVDANGGLRTESTRVARVTFASRERFTYADPFEQPDRFTLERTFAMCRIMARRLRGSPSFVDLERGIYTDEHGKIHELVRREEVIGHLIVQESMILANEALATWCAERGVRVVFRVHSGPIAEAPEEQDALDAFVKRAIQEQDADKLDLLESTLTNHMAQATYSSTPGPHWALQLPLYMHATSPLRRVHDLIAQMQIFAYLEQRPLPVGWHKLDAIIAQLSDDQARDDAKMTARYKRRDEALFLEQLLDDETLSSKQMRRAIRYILRSPARRELHEPILERITRTLDECAAHPSPTVPVALLDVLLESSWEAGRATAIAFLDAHESGWKQVRAHASALRQDRVWWKVYKLDHDPVSIEEDKIAAERTHRELAEQERVAAKRREKRLAQDPLARFNDLGNRELLTSTLSFESSQEDGHNTWHGRLDVTHIALAQTQSFELTAGSKKGVKRTLITQAIVWWDKLQQDNVP